MQKRLNHNGAGGDFFLKAVSFYNGGPKFLDFSHIPMDTSPFGSSKLPKKGLFEQFYWQQRQFSDLDDFVQSVEGLFIKTPCSKPTNL